MVQGQSVCLTWYCFDPQYITYDPSSTVRSKLSTPPTVTQNPTPSKKIVDYLQENCTRLQEYFCEPMRQLAHELSILGAREILQQIKVLALYLINLDLIPDIFFFLLDFWPLKYIFNKLRDVCDPCTISAAQNVLFVCLLS